ncbi:MAG: hypothetical protein AB1758_12600, partial [Candidatus Eremiobacterota bacterium]
LSEPDLPPALRRARALLEVLHRWAVRLLSEEDLRSYQIALLRYAAHTLSFDESGPLQKKWALASVALLADRLL